MTRSGPGRPPSASPAAPGESTATGGPRPALALFVAALMLSGCGPGSGGSGVPGSSGTSPPPSSDIPVSLPGIWPGPDNSTPPPVAPPTASPAPTPTPTPTPAPAPATNQICGRATSTSEAVWGGTIRAIEGSCILISDRTIYLQGTRVYRRSTGHLTGLIDLQIGVRVTVEPSPGSPWLAGRIVVEDVVSQGNDGRD